MRNSYRSYPTVLIVLVVLFLSGSRASAKIDREATPPERGDGFPNAAAAFGARVGLRQEEEGPKPCGGVPDAGSRVGVPRYVLPANLELPREMVAILEQVYDRSSTFRAQCQRIADAPNLRVSIQLDAWMRSSCRAFTMIRRRQRLIHAQVHLPPSGTMFAELISHEFEHVIEQVEGLNLRELACVKGSGVHEVERDLFETDRAKRTRKIVADEVRTTRASRAPTEVISFPSRSERRSRQPVSTSAYSLAALRESW
jgi:hypothetical protein